MFSGYKSEGLTGFGTRFDFSQHFGGMALADYSGTAMLLKCAAEFKKNLEKPVSCAGCMDPRLAPDLIANAVANGEVDYLMMTRPLTVDPELPNKLQQGLREEVAPCCHCMHCHNKGGNALYTRDGGAEYCRVNAATQLAYTEAMPEGYEPLPAEVSKKVVVIGGGPAGMEAARVAAQRGHSVTLFEKNGTLGGLLPVARGYKGDHERLSDLNDYLAHQLDVHGVNVVLGTEATAETVAAESPEVVIVAVGGQREGRLEGSANVPVVAFDDLPAAELGERVVICGAGAQAVDCALYLLAQGKKIQMVHDAPASEVGKEQSMWVRTYVIPQLTSQGVKILELRHRRGRERRGYGHRDERRRAQGSALRLCGRVLRHAAQHRPGRRADRRRLRRALRGRLRRALEHRPGHPLGQPGGSRDSKAPACRGAAREPSNAKRACHAGCGGPALVWVRPCCRKSPGYKGVSRILAPTPQIPHFRAKTAPPGTAAGTARLRRARCSHGKARTPPGQGSATWRGRCPRPRGSCTMYPT